MPPDHPGGIFSMTRVVNIRATKCDVYIGRPSAWGNPFEIGPSGTREEVIRKYEAWIRAQPLLMARLGELEGKRLGCYCYPLPCHGDVLVKLLREKSNGSGQA